LRAALAARLWEGGSSPLDEVRRRAAPDPGVPSRLYDLMDDVRAALRSHRYFDEVLWPRLAALTPDPPEQPPSRRFGRGPSLTHLSEAVTAIERRS
jgi:hypothetical protein